MSSYLKDLYNIAENTAVYKAVLYILTAVKLSKKLFIIIMASLSHYIKIIYITILEGI